MSKIELTAEWDKEKQEVIRYHLRLGGSAPFATRACYTIPKRAYGSAYIVYVDREWRRCPVSPD